MNCKERRIVWLETQSRPISVACGKCIVCLRKRRNEWSFRLLQEHKASTSSFFLTLTYGPNQLPENGLVSKRHLQLWLKRLRKYFPDRRLRYFAVGEYGSKFGRPHYHVLLFNADMLNESILKKTWEHGYVHCGRVTQASVMYTTKYMINRKGNEFTLMSRRFGIGAHYLTDEMVEWHRAHDRNYAVDFGHKRLLPRFYKEKIWRKEELQKLGQKWLWQGIRQERENMRKLLREGYTQEVRESMRNTYLSRIKEKVAYTQKF